MVAEPGNNDRRRRWPRKSAVNLTIAVILVVIIVFVGWAAWNLWFGPYFQDGCFPGCAGFILGGPVTTVPPGSAGCRDLSGNLCYGAWFTTPAPRETFSDLRFSVVNESAPMGRPLPLGPNATITVLGSSNRTIALWNVAGEAWVSGANVGIPRNTEVSIVLDTGLTSNEILANAMLEGDLNGQGSGGVLIFPLGT